MDRNSNWKDILIPITSLISSFAIVVFIFDPLFLHYITINYKAEGSINEYSQVYTDYSLISEDSRETVAFLGASQTKVGIDCEYIESNSNKNIGCYNLGVGGDVPYYRMSELPSLIEASPDYVMIEVSPYMISDLSVLRNFNDTLYMRFGLASIFQEKGDNSVWTDFVREEDKKYVIDDIFEFHSFRNSYRQHILDSRIEEGFESQMSHRGIKENNLEISLAEIKDNKKRINDFLIEPSWQPSTESYNVLILELIIDMLLQNNMSVMLFSLPVDPLVIENLYSGQWNAFNESVSYLVNKTGINYVSFLFEIWSSEQFVDLTHLHKQGIVELNSRLVKDLDIFN